MRALALVNTVKRGNSLTRLGHSNTRDLARCHKGVLKNDINIFSVIFDTKDSMGQLGLCRRATRCHNCPRPMLHTLHCS